MTHHLRLRAAPQITRSSTLQREHAKSPLVKKMTRFWIGVASKDHVFIGKREGFAQLGHGKKALLARLSKGDKLVYYSPTAVVNEKTPCQSFTAIGTVDDDEAAHIPSADCWRRRIKYAPSCDVPIRPLLPTLSFITNKSRWGMPFRAGLVEIPREDFIQIAVAMGADQLE